jgi:hypothetical protein
LGKTAEGTLSKRRRKEELVLIVSTTTVPLEADIAYTGGTSHDHKPVMLRRHEFRLGLLARPNNRSTFAGVEHLQGPWDISGANDIDPQELRSVKGRPGSWKGSNRLAIGVEQVIGVFGPKRRQLFDECMKALNIPDLVGRIPKPEKRPA